MPTRKSDVVVDHPTATLALEVRALLERPSVDQLFLALHVAMQAGLPCESVDAAYRSVADDLWSLEGADRLASFLSEHAEELRAIFDPPKVHVTSPEEVTEADQRPSVDEMLSKIKAGEGAQRTVERLTPQHQGFGPARHAYFVLDRYFRDCDPGACIAAYVRDINPEYHPREVTPVGESALGVASADAGRCYVKLTEDVAEFVINVLVGDCVHALYSSFSAQVKVMGSHMDAGTSWGGCNRSLLRTLHTALLLRACVQALNVDDEPTEESLPIQSGEEFLWGLASGSQAVFDAVVAMRAYRASWTDKHLRFFVALLASSSADRERNVEALFPEADGGFSNPPRIAADWKIFEGICDFARGNDDVEGLRACYEALLDWADSAIVAGNGASSFGFGELGALAYEFYDRPEAEGYSRNRDIRVMLAVATLDLNRAATLDEDDLDADGSDRAYVLRQDAWKYAQLVDAGLRSGLEELANAFLAFGLVTQAMRGVDSGTFLDRGRVSRQMRRLKGCPGWSMTQRAVEVSYEILENAPCGGIDARWLKSHLVGPIAPEARVAGPWLDRAKLEARLQARIGREHWIKLTTTARSCLLDAECMFAACHLEFGLGIQNVGPLIGAYLSAVEREVVAQFEPVLQCEAYAEYEKKTELPTLGTVVHLMGISNPTLPASLREAVAAIGPAWATDRVVRGKLSRARDLRNPASHGEKLDQDQLAEVHRMLYEPPSLLQLLTKV